MNKENLFKAILIIIFFCLTAFFVINIFNEPESKCHKNDTCKTIF